MYLVMKIGHVYKNFRNSLFRFVVAIHPYEQSIEAVQEPYVVYISEWLLFNLIFSVERYVPNENHEL